MSTPNYAENPIPILANFMVKDASELADCMEAIRVLMESVTFLVEEPVEDDDLTPWDRHERGGTGDLPENTVCTVQRTPSESRFGAMYLVRVPNIDICMRFVEVPADLVVDFVGVRFRLGKFRYGVTIGGGAS